MESKNFASVGSLDEISFEKDHPKIDAAYVPKILYGAKSLSDVSADPHWRESRVLVVYTGGTIGMVKNHEGKLIPLVGELENNIRNYPHMNDKNYDSEKVKQFTNPPLVLPDTHEGKRVLYWVYEYQPLLDSSNMTMDDWMRVADDIKMMYEKFDGFVVLHGTDTLAFTASALSFMLQNLGKHVVITGSQIPLFEARSDGCDNFIGSLIMAGVYNIPEVTVFFNNKLFRGNRITKISTGRLNAFDSPNMNPLATAGISIHVDYKAIFRPITLEKFGVYDKLERNVAVLRLFPSITRNMVASCLQPPMKGIVLQTYGAGNMPSNRDDIVEELREATERGVIIINITQCLNGFVESLYETGQKLEEAGVLPGMDMTLEAALTKLTYVLARDECTLQEKREMMTKNIRGEMTVITGESKPDSKLDVLTAIAQALHLTSEEDVDEVKNHIVPNLFKEAVDNCDIAKMDFFYKYVLEINHQDISGWTALHLAASEGSYDTVKWLLEHGASVHVRDKQHHTPLWYAVVNNRFKVIDLLVQTGSYLSETSIRLAETLTGVVAKNDMRKLESFKKAGVDFGFKDDFGRTALHAACTLGLKDMVETLLSYGAPIHVTDKTRLTPSMCAKVNNHHDICRIIEEYEMHRRKLAGT